MQNNNQTPNTEVNFTIIVKNKAGKDLKISARALQQLFLDLDPSTIEELEGDLFEAQQQLIENFNEKATYYQFTKINKVLRSMHMFTQELVNFKPL